MKSTRRLIGKAAVFVVMTVVTGTAVSAAEECGTWSPDLLRLMSWNATSDDRQNITVTIELESTASQPIKMLDAQVRFYDALGRFVDTVSIDPDLHIPAGGTVDTEARTRTQRLVKVEPADLVAVACTRSALFQDGSVQSFD